MGKVYSPEQISYPADTIPQAADFEQAVDNFGEAVNEAIDDNLISGAVLYGSVAIGAYTLQSDFDCMIVPYDHSEQSIATINQIIKHTNPSGRIDIQPIIHPRDRLTSGRHEIDRYFGSHITGPSRIVYGEDPAGYIQYPDYGGAVHLSSYIRHKKRSIATSLIPTDANYYKGLQRVLELPLAIGRKALLVLDEVHGTNEATDDSANLQNIVPRCLQLFSSMGLDETPRRILDLNKRYTEVLKQAINNEITKDEYNVWLQNIRAVGRLASKWLDDFDVAITIL